MKKPDVLILGAGAAGLYLGYILSQKGLKVVIAEASSRVGGRIWSHEGLEAGAALIHGGNSVLKELADFQLVEYQKESGVSYFVWGENLHSRKQALLLPDFEVIDDLITGSNPKNIESLKSSKYTSIIEGWACIYGTNLSRLNDSALKSKNSLWHSGETNYVVSGGYESILNIFLQELKDKILFNTAIIDLKTSSMGCQLTSQNSEIFESEKVAVCVPLGVLKAQALSFTPALPQSKQIALASLGIDPGAKLFLRFKQSFWPADLCEIYGASLCPLYAANGPDVLMAYLVGKHAAQVLGYGPKVVPEKILAELDALFEGKASEHFLEAKLYDWGANPWIRGAYTYPTTESHHWAKILSEPIEGRIFFAGEHTHFEGHQGTVHGALESAERCAAQILGL
jgi:monoamine oxidase